MESFYHGEVLIKNSRVLEALQQVKTSLGLILKCKKEQAMSQKAVIEVDKSAKKRKKRNRSLRGRKRQWDLLKATKKRTMNTEGRIEAQD